MWNRHTCKIQRIEEVPVYHAKEEQDLYKKVVEASHEMSVHDVLDSKKREIKYHQKTFSIKMTKNHFHLFLVPVIIEGKTYQFIVDTGAQVSGLLSKHEHLIEKYLTKTAIPVKSAAGTQKEMQSICVDKLFFGALEITKQPFVVLDSASFQMPLLHKEILAFDGILGWDVLSQFDFEIDAKNNVFSVLQSPELFTYCNLIHALFPIVLVYDEKKRPALFGIDTGAKVSWLDPEYCQRANLKVVKQKKAVNLGVLGMERMSISMIKECHVSFYRSRISLGYVRTGETQVFANLKLDGIFGNEIGKGKKLQFLNSKGIVRILK